MMLIFWLCTGSVFFPTCFVLVRKLLKHTSPLDLNNHDLANISEKCVSSIQALCSCACGIIIMTSCQDIIHDSHWLTNAYACFALPYFVYDVWAMYNTHFYQYEEEIKDKKISHKVYHYAKHTKLLLLHHLFFPLCFFPVILYFRNGLGDFYIGVFYTIEVTIPFISARQVMIQLKQTHHPSYVVIGLSMIAVFTISRILVFPYLYWSQAVYAKIPVLTVFSSIPIKCNIGCLALLLPQIYWLGLMIKGALKYFRLGKSRTLLLSKDN